MHKIKVTCFEILLHRTNFTKQLLFISLVRSWLTKWKFFLELLFSAEESFLSIYYLRQFLQYNFTDSFQNVSHHKLSNYIRGVLLKMVITRVYKVKDQSWPCFFFFPVWLSIRVSLIRSFRRCVFIYDDKGFFKPASFGFFFHFSWNIVGEQLIHLTKVNDERKQTRRSKSMHSSISCD